MKSGIDLLVLDAHGVVFNNPFRPFLRELAERTNQDPQTVLDRWDRELRVPAWCGELEEDQLWRRLLGPEETGLPSDSWRALLESRYELGPAAPFLERWGERVPIWLLSNHRSAWLYPRLERFGLRSVFDRVLVSDALGAVKPEIRAYLPLLEPEFRRDRVLFVDDKESNVRSALDLGLASLWLTKDPASLRTVDRAIFEPETFGSERLTSNPR